MPPALIHLFRVRRSFRQSRVHRFSRDIKVQSTGMKWDYPDFTGYAYSSVKKEGISRYLFQTAFGSLIEPGSLRTRWIFFSSGVVVFVSSVPFTPVNRSTTPLPSANLTSIERGSPDTGAS